MICGAGSCSAGRAGGSVLEGAARAAAANLAAKFSLGVNDPLGLALYNPPCYSPSSARIGNEPGKGDWSSA